MFLADERVWASLAVAYVVLTTSRVADWGHVAWVSDWYKFDPIYRSGKPAVYFLGGKPFAYVVQALPADKRGVPEDQWRRLAEPLAALTR